MKITFLLVFISMFGYAQTPISDANIIIAINTCLSTNLADGMCSASEYGAMPTWDVSSVTNMFYMFHEASSFNGDISGWCVTNITLEPSDFRTDSALSDTNTTVWGTCLN